MRYSEMIKSARAKGVTNEAAMYASIDAVDELLEEMREAHPEQYWRFIRKTHESLYGPHYDECFAKWDIEQLHSTDHEGNRYNGAHWSHDQAVKAFTGKQLPADTTPCDIWVAVNALWHDLHTHYPDEDIVNIAHLFFFQDEDYPAKGKIWHYMNHA